MALLAYAVALLGLVQAARADDRALDPSTSIPRALPADCLPGTLPANPVGPTVTFSMTDSYRSKFTATLWRQPCAGDARRSAVLMRAVPVGGYSVWVCANWSVRQNGKTYRVLYWNLVPGLHFGCLDHYGPAIYVLEQISTSGAFDEDGAFVLSSSWPSMTPVAVEVPAHVPNLATRSIETRILGTGAGRVTSTPSRIDCATGTCRADFPEGAQMRLASEARAGSRFAGWGGDCVSAGSLRTVSVVLTRDMVCVASFTLPTVDPQTGWWWAPSEPGRGYSIELRNGRLHMASYAYRTDGTAVWYLSQGVWDGVRLTTPLIEYGNGAPIGGAWRAPTDRGSVGTISLSFTTPTKGTLIFDNNRSIAIERFPVGGPRARDADLPLPPTAPASHDGAVRLQALRDLVHGRGLQRVVVRLREGATPAADRDRLHSSLAPVGTRVAEPFVALPMFVADVTPAGLDALLADPAVASVHEDARLRLFLSATVPKIRAPQTWERGFSGRGQTIAVLDTGIDSAHPFLGGRVADEACFSASLPALAILSACPNGADTMLGAGSGMPCRYESIGCYHGTHVAGIAAGRSSTFSGVAPDARLISVQVFRHYPAALCGGSPCIGAATSDLIRGLEYVRDNAGRLNIVSVNLSLGGDTFGAYCDGEPYKPVIDQLRDIGVATVAAAGNDGSGYSVASPACISSVVRVGATNAADTLASFTNEWPLPMLFAPGNPVVSSMLGGGFRALNGTSMAAPHVAGAWAVLKGARPTASVANIADALSSSGAPVTGSWTRRTYPRIDVASAHERLSQLETGWWWDAAEPGSGYFVELTDGMMFLSAYTYDEAGRAVWYVANGAYTDGFFEAPLQEFGGGQAIGASWRAPQRKADRGTVALRWNGPGAARLVLPNGRELALTRFAF